MNVWLKGCLVNRINTSLLQSLFHRTMAAGNSETTNRLGQEKSPYLLQHATNPVDWYPWGQEAFDAAKTQNKLIFLSVGYSTCHWCHVMERESFENQEIAKIMNEHFINVKVDREERPDVDKVYMTFVTASSGRGGWPMSVFLTPNLEPIAGGTYFPPTDMYGRPGFASILNSIGSKWTSDKSKLIESGCKIMEVLKKNSKLDEKSSDFPTEEVFARAFVQLSRMYKPEYGGFGNAPKFPQPSNLNFLFAYKALYPLLDDAKTGVDMCLHTLKMMNKGGIHDHIAQGYARYSTDKKWHVPHFEKMIYDQAQLVMAYLDAFLLTKDNSHVDVVRDILAYVNRDLSHPKGGFYSAEDADSFPTFSCKEKREGAFCVWKYHTIKTLLSSPIEEGNTESPLMYQIFNFHYSVMENGNIDPYQDPHDEMKNQNVLIVHGSVAETAEEFGISEEKCQRVLSKCRDILYEERKKRPRPHLDDKMLTAWNGMILSAYARAGAILKDESYIERALQNVKFIQDHLYKNDILYRSAYKCPDGDGITLGSEIEGFSDDYAWVIRGLIHLYNATANQDWLLWAEKLQDKQNDLFWDQKSAGFFLSSPGDSSILLNLKDDHDGAEPSVNSVSCWNLISLSRLLNRSDFEIKISSIFKLFCDRLMKVPASLPEMSVSLLMYLNPAEQIILSGDEGSASFKAMLDTVNSSTFNPNRIILVAGTEPNSLLYSRVEHLKKYFPKFGQDCGGAGQDSGKVGQDYVEVGQNSVGSCQDSVDVGQGITPVRQDTVVYLCKDFACSLPVKSASCLRAKMASQAAL